jgi:hypothetical protein
VWDTCWSSGPVKLTAVRSPIMPAGIIAGAAFSGPSLLESVLNCRLPFPKGAPFCRRGRYATGSWPYLMHRHHHIGRALCSYMKVIGFGPGI